jgi:DNA-binding NarL/FixJ family response regulator
MNQTYQTRDATTKARIERAEARVANAEARTQLAETRIEQAKSRAESAETRTDMAETRTEYAKTRTEHAEIRQEQAESRAEQAETRAESAESTLDSLIQNESRRCPQDDTPAEDSGDQQTLARLTSRQREVLQLMARGDNTKQIAHVLSVSPKTIEYHRAKLMAALKVHDITALVRFALRAGLVPPEG